MHITMVLGKATEISQIEIYRIQPYRTQEHHSGEDIRLRKQYLVKGNIID